MSKKKASKRKNVKSPKPRRNVIRDTTFIRNPVIVPRESREADESVRGERRLGVDRRSINQIKLDAIMSILKSRGMPAREIGNARKEIESILEHITS